MMKYLIATCTVLVLVLILNGGGGPPRDPGALRLVVSAASIESDDTPPRSLDIEYPESREDSPETEKEDQDEIILPSTNCTQERRAAITEYLSRSQTLGKYDFIPPKTDIEFLGMCTQIKTTLYEMTSYLRECTRPVTAQILTMIMKSLVKSHRTVCRSKRLRAEALQHIQCLSPDVAYPMHDCARAGSLKIKWLGSLRYRAFSPDWFIPALCCVTHQGMNCVINSAREACAPVVDDPEETAEYMQELFGDLSGETMEMFCGKFSSVDHCRHHIPNIMRAFDRVDYLVGEADNSRRSALSLILPLMDVFQRDDINEDDDGGPELAGLTNILSSTIAPPS